MAFSFNVLLSKRSRKRRLATVSLPFFKGENATNDPFVYTFMALKASAITTGYEKPFFTALHS